MNQTKLSSFSSFQLNRRSFVGGCAGCTLGLTAMAHAAAPLCTLSRKDVLPDVKARVRVVFTHEPPDRPTWPNVGYDYEGRKEVFLKQLRNYCKDVEFLPVTVQTEEETQNLLAEDEDIDGYVNIILGLWTPVSRVLAASENPLIMVDDLYGGSGQFLVEYARALREGYPVVGISSTDIKDLVRAIRCFTTMKKMRASKILDVTNKPEERLWGGVKLENIKERYGTEVQLIRGNELEEAYRKVEKEEAKLWAEKWIKQARMVIEPSDEEIEKSAAMYIALQNLMLKHEAQAITIDCLGLFYADKMSAYPCLGFFQLNNDGLVGACESDLHSTLSMLLMGYLVEKPGFISDPVIDTSKNQIIYAHCVGMNQVDGPEGKSNPFDIRDHSEDRKGAAIRSLMPLGRIVTTLEFRSDRKEVIYHQGRTVANIDEDKACRTKLAAELIGDMDKLMREWDQWGWHRVTFFGDYKKDVENYAALNGMKVIHEA